MTDALPVSATPTAQTGVPGRPRRVRPRDGGGSAPGAAQAKTAANATAHEAAKIVEEIERLDQQSARDEDQFIRNTFQKGRLLRELRSAAKQGEWGESLKRIHLPPRVALRLIGIAEWAGDFGPNESEFVSQLPLDLHKLDWLRRLEPDQLRRFLEVHNCRNQSREAVIKAVKQIPGVWTPRPALERAAKPAPETPETIENLIRRLVERLDAADEATKQKFFEPLASVITKLKATSSAPSPQPSGVPGRPNRKRILN
jgi:hypothetical protein